MHSCRSCPQGSVLVDALLSAGTKSKIRLHGVFIEYFRLGLPGGAAGAMSQTELLRIQIRRAQSPTDAVCSDF